MAYGFSPKYIQELPLDDLSQEHFLVLMIAAAKKLDWEMSYISENGFIAFTKFSLRYSSQEVKVKIESGSANLKSECTGTEMVDWGRNKKNIQDLIATFNELKKSYTLEELEKSYEEMKPTLVSSDQSFLSQPPPTTKEKITSVFAIFKPTPGYFITPIIINLNIAIFIVMIITGVDFILPSGESLIKWGANFRPVTLEGEWWRLITNCFLHIGIFHLLMNMYALLYIGLLLESHLGKLRFVMAYFLAGIIASISSLYWHELAISAGASGAIFGMYGVFIAMLTTNLIEKSARKALLTSIAIFVGYNVLNGLKPDSGIDNAAHIGGLLGGIIIGYALIPSLKKPEASKLKYTTIVVLTFAILVSSFIFIINMPNDIGTYDNKMKNFVSMEEKALGIYRLPPNTPDEQVLSSIKNEGIYYWNENIKLIDSFNDLDLPIEIRTRNKLLKEYCELRIKSYELLYKMISENTEKYKEQLENYNKQIEAKINEISAQH